MVDQPGEAGLIVSPPDEALRRAHGSWVLVGCGLCCGRGRTAFDARRRVPVRGLAGRQWRNIGAYSLPILAPAGVDRLGQIAGRSRRDGAAVAIAMHAVQAGVNETWIAAGRAPFGIGIGLSTGEVAAARSEERQATRFIRRWRLIGQRSTGRRRVDDQTATISIRCSIPTRSPALRV